VEIFFFVEHLKNGISRPPTFFVVLFVVRVNGVAPLAGFLNTQCTSPCLVEALNTDSRTGPSFFRLLLVVLVYAFSMWGLVGRGQGIFFA
jgi:hypothetical protein